MKMGWLHRPEPAERVERPLQEAAPTVPCCGLSPMNPDGYHLCTEPIGHDGDCMDARYVWTRWTH